MTFLYGMHGAGINCILPVICTDKFPVFRFIIAMTMKIQFAFAVGTEQNPCKDTLFTEVRPSAFALTNPLYNVPCVLNNDWFLRILNELMLRFRTLLLSVILIGDSSISEIAGVGIFSASSCFAICDGPYPSARDGNFITVFLPSLLTRFINSTM